MEKACTAEKELMQENNQDLWILNFNDEVNTVDEQDQTRVSVSTRPQTNCYLNFIEEEANV